MTMDNSQLPRPTLPTDAHPTTGGQAGGSPQPVPPSAAPSTSAQPVRQPFGPTVAPVAAPTQSEQQPVFRSPIIEGLQQMQSAPFQMPATSRVSPVTSPVSSSGNGAQAVSTSLPAEKGTEKTGSSTTPVRETAALGKIDPPVPSKSATEKSVTKIANAGSRFSLPNLGSKKVLGLVAVLALFIVGGIGWFLFQSMGKSADPNVPPVANAKITLTYWGLWENDDVIAPLIAKYEGLHPDIKIEYQYQNHRQYRSRLQADIRQGNGPDIFRFHNTWMPMLKDDLATAPSSALSASEMKEAFYPVMSQDLVSGNQVYGVPLMYDGLALVYNESMLETANALPPKDWKALREVAAALTIKNDPRLERGGVAMGTAENVDNFSDILGLLMLQNNAQPADPSSENAQTALEYYTLFSRVDGGWDLTMRQSTLAFANEQVAMIFVPSWRLHEIRDLNPNLRFGVAPVPQLSENRIAWATYWAEGVNKKSTHSKEAWEFITWLSQPEQLRQMYAEASKYRGFGELYPRVEMASELAQDATLAPYLDDALYAQSWYMASRTHDEGLNDQIISYYQDAINTMNKEGKASVALEAVAPGIKSVLQKFGVSAKR